MRCGYRKLSEHHLFLCIVHVLLAVLLSGQCLSAAPVVALGHRCKHRCYHPRLLRAPTVNAPSEARTTKLCCSTVFMFGTKRSALLKRLSKIPSHETQRTVETLLKRLNVAQLEALATSVETRGAEEAPCILLPVGELRLGRGSPISAHVLFCQLFRWIDLVSPHELRRLPNCLSPQDRFTICCNPYHWSRHYKPDSPPPPYTRHPQELKVEDSVPSEPLSRFTSHLTESSESSLTWCNIAYWELSSRVGRLLPVTQPTINVFANLPHGDGLCLETLTQSRNTENSSVQQTRTKVGHGITLFRENQAVWMYNRSGYSVFVNSPTLDPPNTRNLTVHKVLPGYSIKIFDYERSKYNQRCRDPSLLKDGPFDPHAVRISFVKGWGSNYSRRFVTSCPCWLEVMFLVNR
ncbi:Mothers against decapentaplegic-like protein, partial [Stegodyphus mimosarum]